MALGHSGRVHGKILFHLQKESSITVQTGESLSNSLTVYQMEFGIPARVSKHIFCQTFETSLSYSIKGFVCRQQSLALQINFFDLRKIGSTWNSNFNREYDHQKLCS